MTDHQHPADADDTRRHDLPTTPDDRRPDRPGHAGHPGRRFSPTPDPRPVVVPPRAGDRPGRDPRALVRAGPGGRHRGDHAPVTAPTTVGRPDQPRPTPARSSSPPPCPRSSPRAAPSSPCRRPAPSTSRPPARSRPTARPSSGSQPVTIDESSATIDVAAKVSPAVVRITTSSNVDTSNGVIPETGVGSGVIYDANGWILTNRHVVEGSDTMQVELLDGRVLTGTVYGIDTLTDLAIVKVEETGPPDRRARRLRRAQGRPARRRHRQPAGHVLELGHQRHRVGQGPLDHDRRQPDPQQPHPDRRGHQPGQLGWPAARRQRRGRRHQHRHRRRQQRHRLRHPHRHRPADHGPGRRRARSWPARTWASAT